MIRFFFIKMYIVYNKWIYYYILQILKLIKAIFLFI